MTTRLADLIVPEVFTPYSQLLTAQKSALIRAGAIIVSPRLSAHLAGGGLIFNEPFFRDLVDEEENVSNDNPADLSEPSKIGTGMEKQVRLSRNHSWSSMDLNDALTGEDPMEAIAGLVSNYWVRRLQAGFISTAQGVFANNDTVPGAGAYFTQGDLSFDASGSTFIDGVTNFNASNYVNAISTLGDCQDELSLIMVHSVVYSTMKKNNLIDFIADSVNGNVVSVPTYLGLRVVIDDQMPRNGGVFDSWIFRRGTFRLGQGSPKVPTAVERVEAAGNGGGQETLHNRVEWALHPVGHAFVGNAPAGGPSNAATANNLANAGSWQRVFNERKQIKIARLRTREF